MTIKKKLGLGIASAALGISLIGGGTFAYFSDKVETTSKFAAGTLDLSVNPSTIVDVGTIKPKDRVFKAFKLENKGTLDIKEVLIDTAYSITNKAGEPANADDFGKHIRVNFLENTDKTAWEYNDVISYTTLYDLQNKTPDAVESLQDWWVWWGENSGLPAGTSDDMYVSFEFVDNNGDQNQFQGDSLELKWTFNATQTDGRDIVQ